MDRPWLLNLINRRRFRFHQSGLPSRAISFQKRVVTHTWKSHLPMPKSGTCSVAAILTNLPRSRTMTRSSLILVKHKTHSSSVALLQGQWRKGRSKPQTDSLQLEGTNKTKDRPSSNLSPRTSPIEGMTKMIMLSQRSKSHRILPKVSGRLCILLEMKLLNSNDQALMIRTLTTFRLKTWNQGRRPKRKNHPCRTQDHDPQ